MLIILISIEFLSLWRWDFEANRGTAPRRSPKRRQQAETLSRVGLGSASQRLQGTTCRSRRITQNHADSVWLSPSQSHTVNLRQWCSVIATLDWHKFYIFIKLFKLLLLFKMFKLLFYWVTACILPGQIVAMLDLTARWALRPWPFWTSPAVA